MGLTLAGVVNPALFFVLMSFVGVGNGILMPSATVGMLSVRSNLVGSASGVGAALMTIGGALLSVLAGFLVYPGSGIAPLVLAMIASIVISEIGFLIVFRWERAHGKALNS